MGTSMRASHFYLLNLMRALTLKAVKSESNLAEKRGRCCLMVVLVFMLILIIFFSFGISNWKVSIPGILASFFSARAYCDFDIKNVNKN
jgi:hypothetical protein